MGGVSPGKGLWMNWTGPQGKRKAAETQELNNVVTGTKRDTSCTYMFAGVTSIGFETTPTHAAYNR